jgi:hypothetical protein
LVPINWRFIVITDVYLDAKRAFERIDYRVSDLAERIGKVAHVLNMTRGVFCFSKTPGDFTPEVVRGRNSVSEDGNTWLSAADINAALVEWHTAKGIMNRTWAVIPQDRREGLKPPPDIVLPRFIASAAATRLT